MSQSSSVNTRAVAQREGWFKSFWLGGFESACHINSNGHRVDMIAQTQHDQMAWSDYAMLDWVGISTVRDGTRWHLIDQGGGKYDFSSWGSKVEAAQELGVQVIWSLCHYGWPADVDAMSPQFIRRFERYCTAIARFLRDNTDQTPIYTPVNEISFLTWAITKPGWFYPDTVAHASELKRQLVRAAIAGCEALWAVDPNARITSTDPLIHVLPPRGRPELAPAAKAYRESQFGAWDMLCGLDEPQLGGSPRYLGTIGVNYYHCNQFEYPDARLRWEDDPRDPRWVPLHMLLAEVYERYKQPLFISETSHFGCGRAKWLREITQEVHQACSHGVPLEGVCLYPIIDRPDWENFDHWHNSGLWDLLPDAQGRLQRVLNEEYAAELRRSQKLLARCGYR